MTRCTAARASTILFLEVTADVRDLAATGYSFVRTGDNAYSVTDHLHSPGDVDLIYDIEFLQFISGASRTPLVTLALTTGGVAVNDATPNVGQTLSAVSTLANSSGLSINGYQWQALTVSNGWANIPSATQASFTPTSAQSGQQLRVVVNFSDAVGAGQLAVSPATSALAGAGSAVLIDGLPTEDQVLAANTSLVNDPQGLGVFSYQWLRNDAAIAGATSVSYKLGDDDVGKQIKLRLSYTDGADNAEVLTSDATALVANINDAPTAAIALINPTPVSGQNQTVSVVVNSLVDADGVPKATSFVWQWQSAPLNTGVWARAPGAISLGPAISGRQPRLWPLRPRSTACSCARS